MDDFLNLVYRISHTISIGLRILAVALLVMLLIGTPLVKDETSYGMFSGTQLFWLIVIWIAAEVTGLLTKQFYDGD